MQLLAALAASVFTLGALPAAAGGLKISAFAGPAPAPAASPGVAPGPAPDPIRPGVVVRIVGSKKELLDSFKGQKIFYHAMMDEMLGKDYVVKEMKFGGAGLSSPDGSQKDVWYFPEAALKPWLATKDAKAIPVAAKGYKAMGLPTNPKFGVGPPGRHDAPWDYTLKHRGLFDPIAPPYNERVDLENGQALPPMMKVKQVVSVECMDKLHKDPSHLCAPEAYINYNLVTSAPTTQAPPSHKEVKALKKHIKHLESTIDSLTPDEKAPKKMARLRFKAPGMHTGGKSMNAVIGYSEGEKHSSADGANKKMNIGKDGSEERMNSAQGHGEKEIQHQKKKNEKEEKKGDKKEEKEEKKEEKKDEKKEEKKEEK